jgi:hypothetical protein
MTTREKVLAGVIGLAAGGWLISGQVRSNLIEPLAAKTDEIDRLTKAKDAKKIEYLKAERSIVELGQFKARALPGDVNLSQTLYNAYLGRLCKEAGIAEPTITAISKTDKQDHYTKLGFSLTARTDLAALGKLLASFYSDGMLHQIRQLKLQPVREAGKVNQFEVNLTLEALAMKDAVAKKDLPEKKKAGPAGEAGLLAYKNPFQPTKLVAKAEPRRDTRPTARDERSDYVFTGAVEIDGVAEAWLSNSKSKKKIRLTVGGDLAIDGMKAKVLGISPREVTLEVGGKVGSVRMGKDLTAWLESARVPAASTGRVTAAEPVGAEAEKAGAVAATEN